MFGGGEVNHNGGEANRLALSKDTRHRAKVILVMEMPSVRHPLVPMAARRT